MAMTTRTLLNGLRFTLWQTLLNYMLMLTLHLQGYRISFLQALRQEILLRVTGFHNKEKYIWAFGYPSMMQDSPSGNWISHRREIHTGFRLSEFDARFFFGLLAFTWRNCIWGFSYSCFMQDSPSSYWLSPPKQVKLYVEWLCRDLTEVHSVFGTT